MSVLSIIQPADKDTMSFCICRRPATIHYVHRIIDTVTGNTESITTRRACITHFLNAYWTAKHNGRPVVLNKDGSVAMTFRYIGVIQMKNIVHVTYKARKH